MASQSTISTQEIQTAYQFTTSPISFKLHVFYTVNNLDLIKMCNNKNWGIKIFTNIELQLQDIIKQADVADNQLVDIKNIILQVGEENKMQIGRDIYRIVKIAKRRLSFFFSYFLILIFISFWFIFIFLSLELRVRVSDDITQSHDA